METAIKPVVAGDWGVENGDCPPVGARELLGVVEMFYNWSVVTAAQLCKLTGNRAVFTLNG